MLRLHDFDILKNDLLEDAFFRSQLKIFLLNDADFMDHLGGRFIGTFNSYEELNNYAEKNINDYGYVIVGHIRSKYIYNGTNFILAYTIDDSTFNIEDVAVLEITNLKTTDSGNLTEEQKVKLENNLFYLKIVDSVASPYITDTFHFKSATSNNSIVFQSFINQNGQYYELVFTPTEQDGQEIISWTKTLKTIEISGTITKTYTVLAHQTATYSTTTNVTLSTTTANFKEIFINLYDAGMTITKNLFDFKGHSPATVSYLKAECTLIERGTAANIAILQGFYFEIPTSGTTLKCHPGQKVTINGSSITTTTLTSRFIVYGINY